jgi:hypothetical protein
MTGTHRRTCYKIQINLVLLVSVVKICVSLKMGKVINYRRFTRTKKGRVASAKYTVHLDLSSSTENIRIKRLFVTRA